MYPLCSNWLNLAIERVKKGKKTLELDCPIMEMYQISFQKYKNMLKENLKK